MPRNLFSDPFGGLQEGYQTAGAITDDIRSKYARNRAAPKIAQGDFHGAAQTYGAMGMDREAAAAFSDQQTQEDRGTQAKERERVEGLRKADTLIKAASALKRVPPAERRQALGHPIFQHLGITPELTGGLTDEQLSDQSLDMFVGEVERIKGVVLAPGSQLRNPETGGLMAEAPAKPEYRTVGPDQSLVEVGAGPSAPAAGANIAGPLAELEAAGVTVSSNVRTPERNAAVGGAPGSRHMSGEAVDLVPPKGVSMAQLAQEASRRFPGARIINEGDHVHVQWGQGQRQGGARVVAQGPPKAKPSMVRPATPEEKAAFGIPADVPAKFNPDTGDVQVISGVGARARVAPAQIQGGYIANQTAIGQIDAAILQLKARPNAMGFANLFGDEIRQRADPNGIKTRASVAEVGAVKIHDLSGAAVTAAETPRLKPFIPMPTDTAQAAIKKLEQLRGQVENNNRQMETQYSEENGFAPLTRRPTAPGGLGGSGALKSDPRAIQAARDAIKRGAPKAAVIKRLRDNGINPAGL